MGVQVKEVKESESLSVMEGIRVSMLSGAKASLLLTGLSLQESLENLINEGRQMMATLASAPSASLNWKTIDWETVEQHVKRLQMRIANAYCKGCARK